MEMETYFIIIGLDLIINYKIYQKLNQHSICSQIKHVFIIDII